MSAEHRVRAAAAELLAAVAEAKAAGIIVQWPARPEGLARLAISETGAVAAAPRTVAARAPRKHKG